MEKVLTPDEVAEILQIEPSTVKRWFREGKLPGFKVGKVWRIKQSALDDYMNQQRELREFAETEADKTDGQHIIVGIRCDSCGHMFIIEDYTSLMEKAAQGELPTCPGCNARIEKETITEETACSYMELQEEAKNQFKDRPAVRADIEGLKKFHRELRKKLQEGD